MQHHSTQYIKEILTKTKRRNKQEYNNSCGLQFPTVNNGEIVQTENHNERVVLKYYRTNGPNRHTGTVHLTATGYSFFSSMHRKIFQYR